MRVFSKRAVLGAAALVALLAFGTTANAAINLCLAGKIKCVAKKKACLFKCYNKALGTGLGIAAGCTEKCRSKFDGGTKGLAAGCFGKLEIKYPGGCLTTGDTRALECKVDGFVRDVVEELIPPFPVLPLNKCQAGKVKCVLKKDDCLLKAYNKEAKTGAPLDLAAVAKCRAKYDGGTAPAKGCFAKLDVKYAVVTPCLTFGDSAALEAKEDAFLDDLLCELNIGQTMAIDSRRCSGDTRQHCNTTVPDCNVVGGTCEFYFGTYLPLSAGGVSTCVGNQFNGPVSGTANVDTGVSVGTANLKAAVYTGPTADQPCPKCVNDVWANDGVQNGTCQGGLHNGQLCDTNGSAVNPLFGDTSLDCSPAVTALVATLPIDLTNTTGVRSKTLTAANPSCTATGFTTLKCFCDTCNTLAQEPCSSNADCPNGPDAPGAPVIGAICGGKRCLANASPDKGDACTADAQCTTGSCGVPGLQTAPNGCDDATCTANTGPDYDSCNEGVCANGPFEQFCGPTATFVQCTDNTPCLPFGETCSVGKLRQCYTDNGAVNAVVQSCGNADPPLNHWSRPTLASLFCVGPTSSSAVNSVAGLPGLGRLQLAGVARDNGTLTQCPSEIDFMGRTGKGILDAGWTGQSHDSTIVSGGLVTVSVTASCVPGIPPNNCGVCSYTGPIPNPIPIPTP